jgi:hypothetical protein
MNSEELRLKQEEDGVPWKKWGPYLSERQWGTVREDYSDDSDAWNYFTHDQSRARAYRWGEDGIGGISDNHQVLCFSLAMWNGQDAILKERLFGLTNSEGNHGEDVKECYFYLDSTPTHSYLKYLYKYPQRAYPYNDLIETNQKRGKLEREYELTDTGAFDDDRYFDVFVEYAKEDPRDICIKITAFNRGPEEAELHLLPTLLYRNTWSWSDSGSKPLIQQLITTGSPVISANHTDPLFLTSLMQYYLYCGDNPEILFTENETNNAKLFGGENASGFVKDGINDFVVNGKKDAVNPELEGTKCSAHYSLKIAPGQSQTVRLRLSHITPEDLKQPFAQFDSIVSSRINEADTFYKDLTPSAVSPERALILRQALAGMLWSKQYFYYDVDKWLCEHNVSPWSGSELVQRNNGWAHMYGDDIISMPDKWEYPWFAAWDLAFHMIPLSMVDPNFAKDQLNLMLKSNYLHPNGQIPAYEWNFSDVNPPVHAWATMQSYLLDKHRHDPSYNAKGDLDFLRMAFSKLLMNFGWWVNRKDLRDSNVFSGGFLGLDNIGVFDRSKPLPTGGYLEQADGTAWMAFYSQQMLRIAVELALHDPLYEDFAIKFFEHTMWISGSMDRLGEHQDELWDEEDGFFYDVLRLPDGQCMRLKVRSIVGLLPIMATVVFAPNIFEKLPAFKRKVEEFVERHPEISATVHLPTKQGQLGRRMLSVVDENKLRRILSRMFDEDEFLSPYGIRSMSKHHLDNPYEFHYGGEEFKVSYVPGESDSGLFGGNSNWRGPVWMPVNFLLFRELMVHYAYFGDDFKMEYPTRSGKYLDLFEIAMDIANRLIGLFVPDDSGKRPANRNTHNFEDPHWKELVLFHEYFDGESGAGLGATHQTGWTGLVARFIHMTATLTKDVIMAQNAERLSVRIK